MKSVKRYSAVLVILLVLTLGFSLTYKAFAADETTAVAAEAAEEEADDSTGSKALAAALVVGLAAAAGALGMGIAVGKSSESMARQPEVAGKINSSMMLGLVFIETAIIYALIIAILIIFVL